MSRVRPLLIPFSLFLLALVVRVIGLTWGLPNAGRWGSYHPDESTHQIVGAVVSVLQGDLNPHFFNYPSLCVYATSALYFMLQIAGLTTNVPSPQYPWPVVHDIILAGRLFSALCGAAMAVCVWGMAREVGLRRGALLAGILAALCPGLVQHSHFATVDVPATFFVALCLWFTLSAANDARPNRSFKWTSAAVAAGLAAGAKYNAGLVILAPMIGYWLMARSWSNPTSSMPRSWVWSQPLLAAFAFFLSTPYALLAPSEFWGDPAKKTGFSYELLVHPREGSGDVFEATGLGWIYHLTFNLPFVLTWPLLLAGLGGAWWALRNRKQWPLLAFALLYFLIIGASNVRFMRYTFLLVPPLLVWAALAVSRLPKPALWAGALGLFALWGTKDALAPMVSTDQRDLAAAYMKSVGGTPTLINKPWFFTPPFQPQNNNEPVAGIKITGLDASRLNARTDTLAVNDYEVREGLRLHADGPEAKFLQKAQALKATTAGSGDSDSGIFRWNDPAALPGRKFEPHDYLYTHPGVRVYRVR